MTPREALDILVKSLKDIKSEHEDTMSKAMGMSGKPGVPSSARKPAKGSIPAPASPPTGLKPKMAGKSGFKQAFAPMDKKDTEATPKVKVPSLKEMNDQAGKRLAARKPEPKGPGSNEVTKPLAKEHDCAPKSGKMNKMMGYMKSHKGNY